MITPLGFVLAVGNNNGGQLGFELKTPNAAFLRFTELAKPAGDSDGGNNDKDDVPALITAVAAGAEHSVGLAADGTVLIWGSLLKSRFNKPTQVPGLDSIIAIAAGYGFCLALRADGTVYSWGVNDKGQLGLGHHMAEAKPIRVHGFGNSGHLEHIVAISAGPTHCLALNVDGTVASWGANGKGQLGLGSTTPGPFPDKVLHLTRVIGIAAGGSHSLALAANGEVSSWGWNGKGQLGIGSTDDQHAPTLMKPLSNIVEVAAGNEFSMARHVNGQVHAFGSNQFGQLGNDSVKDAHDPVLVLSSPGSTQPLRSVVKIAAGETHCLFLLANGEPRACGYNNASRLGDGTETDRHTPVPMIMKILGDNRLPISVGFAAGPLHSLLILHAGGTWGWGDNGSGQAGPIPLGSPKATAILLKGTPFPRSIDAGGRHSLAIAGGAGNLTFDHGVKGQMLAWGVNASGQLGLPTNAPHLGIQTHKITAAEIAGGGSHSLALLPDGTVLGWGANSAGQTGTAPPGVSVQKPTLVKDPIDDGNLEDIKAIAAGEAHSLALRANGKVFAWGQNDHGQLGNGTNGNSHLPVLVKTASGPGALADIVAIAAGGNWSMALRADGYVFIWGQADKGQLNRNPSLGDSSLALQALPTLGTTPRVKAIAAGSAHGLILRADGIVWSWGFNNTGQLGDGTKQDRSGIATVKYGAANDRKPITFIKAIAAGGILEPDHGAHSLALLANGQILSWGWNAYGQLGIDTGSLDQVSADKSVATLSLPDPTLGDAQTYVPLPRVVAITAGGTHSLAIGPRMEQNPPKHP